MSEPEIARRCYYCGASIRERAAFCPQCGRALAGAPDLSEPSPIHDTEDVIVKDITLTEADFQKGSKAPTLDEKPAPKSKPEKPAEPKPQSTPESQSTAAADTVAIASTPETPERAKGPGHRVPYVGAKVHKATQRARDVQDNALHRVQKVREISTVMIEEAGYDPSLRFILVAGVLFVLFLLIMLLNKLIG